MTGGLTRHASCIALEGAGLLILGPSGSGKSALALAMIGLGAKLVSDDLVALEVEEGALMARCPRPALQGVIEARGIGLLRAPFVAEVPVALVVDLGQPETDRLPPRRRTVIAGVSLPLVLQPQNDHLALALSLYLRGGRVE